MCNRAEIKPEMVSEGKFRRIAGRGKVLFFGEGNVVFGSKKDLWIRKEANSSSILQYDQEK